MALATNQEGAWSGAVEGAITGAAGEIDAFTFGRVKGAFGADAGSAEYGYGRVAGGIARDSLMSYGGARVLKAAYSVPSTLHHFTSTTAAAAIRASGTLRAGGGLFGRGVYGSKWASGFVAKLMGAGSVEASISFSTKGLSVARTLVPGTFRVIGDVGRASFIP